MNFCGSDFRSNFLCSLHVCVASRTEVERRRDQAQRERASMAQITNDQKDVLMMRTNHSLFQPPSKVSEGGEKCFLLYDMVN